MTTDHPGHQELAPPTSETRRLLLVKLMPILLVSYIFCFLDRTKIGMVKDRLDTDVGISAAVYGIGAGLFFITYAGLEIPSNLIMHRVGARFWISRIMVTWGVVAIAMALIQGPTSFYIIRLLLGAGEAGLYPGVIYLISKWWPQEDRAQVQGVFLLGACVASIVGSPLTGLLMKMDGVGGLFGWQWMFILTGLLPVLWAFVVWKKLPDRPTQAAWLDPAVARDLERYIESENVAGARQAGNHNLMAALKDIQIPFTMFAYFANQLAVYAMAYFLPSMISDGAPGLSSFQVGLLASVPWIFAMVGVLLIPKLATQDGKPKKWMVLATVGMTVGLLVAVLGSPWVAFVGFCIVGFCFLAPQPLFFAHVGSRLAGALLPAGLAAVTTMGLMGGFLGPSIMGGLEEKTGNNLAGLWFIIAVQIVGLVAIALIRPRTVRKPTCPKVEPPDAAVVGR